ncbi:MAG: YggS family pyridoxal phosphate-dependent enzyme [Myxococcota bacterium]|jgi:hypothetical protein|nr:YggS family pyridoxal phosphate-dependent enzyme [Myxococcota bacterium]
MKRLLGALEETHAHIEKAAAKAGRSSHEITLVAVSKRQPIDKCFAAYDAGQRVFAENTAQELLPKAEAFKASGRLDVQWHFVGRLQRNKVRKVVPWIDLLQSLDKISLAESLEKELGGESLDVLVQVNLGMESQKGGVCPADAVDFCQHLSAFKSLKLRGVMGIPPRSDAPRSFFATLKKIQEMLATQVDPKCTLLSMGMSNDFEDAIQEGANMVRIGEGIFGPRA